MVNSEAERGQADVLTLNQLSNNYGVPPTWAVAPSPIFQTGPLLTN
jgi:hypothetical protein